MRRRELRLVFVLQDALELVDAPLHEAPPGIEVNRPSLRHLALRFRLGLFGPGRHCGSRGREGGGERASSRRGAAQREREREKVSRAEFFLMLLERRRGEEKSEVPLAFVHFCLTLFV